MRTPTWDVLAVLARLADIIGLPLRRLLHRWHDDDPDDTDDSSVVGRTWGSSPTA